MSKAKKRSTKPNGPAKTKPQRIILNMIVKDESKVIAECLSGVAHLISYYVINDTGSTDGTQQIIKDFFDKRSIPGEIIEHEFRSCVCHPEAVHKSSKFFHFGNNRDYALQRCKGKGEYILFMDADDIAEGLPQSLPILTADQYFFIVKTNANIYYKPLLIKNDPKLMWKWCGGLHEYLLGNPQTSIRLEGNYCIHSRRLGARNEDPLKYYKDAEHLEGLMNEIVDKTDELYIRYAYYYAQSWFDAKEYTKAIDAYNHVIQIAAQGPMDQLFSCRYMSGMCQLMKGTEPDEIERIFADIADKHTNYAEPLFQLTVYFNMLGQHQKAFDYGVRALGITKPMTMFYINADLYKYRLLDELVVAATRIGKFNQALKWAQRMIQERQYPEAVHEVVTRNVEVLTTLIKQQQHDKAARVNVDPNKKRICFYVGASPLFAREMFGSEGALLQLAKELSSTYNVYIVGSNLASDEPPPISEHVVILAPDELSNIPEQFDVMIVSRYASYLFEFDVKQTAKQTLFWLHDIDLHPYWNNTHLPSMCYPLLRNAESVIDGYITLSPWHRNHFINTYKVSPSKVWVIGNGIGSTIPDIPVAQKVPGRFIWVSDPARGLLEFVSNFPKILKIIPSAHIDVYRTLPSEMLAVVRGIPFVNVKGHLDQTALMHEFAKAEYFMYPTNWPETYCISAHEAQALKCTCIVSDLAALSTTVGDERGVLLRKAYGTEDFWQEAAAVVAELESNPQAKEAMTLRAREWALANTWDKRAKEWVRLFGDGPT